MWCRWLRDELHLAKFLVPALFDRPRIALTHRDYKYIDKLNSPIPHTLPHEKSLNYKPVTVVALSIVFLSGRGVGISLFWKLLKGEFNWRM